MEERTLESRGQSITGISNLQQKINRIIERGKQELDWKKKKIE